MGMEVINIPSGTAMDVGRWTLTSSSTESEKTGVVVVSLEDDDMLSIAFGATCVFIPRERVRRLLESNGDFVSAGEGHVGKTVRRNK